MIRRVYKGSHLEKKAASFWTLSKRGGGGGGLLWLMEGIRTPPCAAILGCIFFTFADTGPHLIQGRQQQPATDACHKL